MKILLTGATGYVGGRLLAVLEGRGYEVRCLARYPANLASHVGRNTHVVAGDVLNPASLVTALEDMDVAYFLVHSMGDGSGFEQRETMSAENVVKPMKFQDFVEAVRQVGAFWRESTGWRRGAYSAS